VRVQTFLREGLGTNHAKFVAVSVELVRPEGVSVLIAFVCIMRYVHASFMSKSLPGDLIHFTSEESKFGSNFLGSLACLFNLKSRGKEGEVRTKFEVPVEKLVIHGESS